MAKRICIDAGHYGKYNLSPANKKYYESEAMWKLHLLQKKYLEEYGFEVILTRADQTKDLGLTDRGKKSIGCDFFISDHSNAVGSYVNENVDHAVAYCLTDDKTTKIDEISKEIGLILAETVTSVMGLKDKPRIATRLSDTDRNGDGVMNDNYYGVLNGARLVGTPGIILEHSFHTNTKSTNWLLVDANLDKLAKAEADAIAKYFGVTKQEATPAPAPTTPSTEEKKYYRVRKSWSDAKSQIGAYTNLNNAKKNCKDGYKVFDWNGNVVYPVETTKVESTPAPTEPFKPYMIKVDVSKIYDRCLNIREKPDADSRKVSTIVENVSLTVVEEAKDSNGKVWGLLKGYSKYRNGWLRLDYTTRI